MPFKKSRGFEALLNQPISPRLAKEAKQAQGPGPAPAAAAAAALEEDEPIDAIWTRGEVPSGEVLDKLSERVRKLVSSLELPHRGSAPTPSFEESLKVLREATTHEAAPESTWRLVAKPMPNIFAMAAEAAKAPGSSEGSKGATFSGGAWETSGQHPARSTAESAASPRTAAPPTSTLPKLGEALMGSLMKEQGEEDLPREPTASDTRRGTSSTASRDGGVSRHENEKVVPVRDPKDLPPGWAAAYSEEYQCQYYFNRALGISSWEWPSEGPGRSEDRRIEQLIDVSLASGAPDIIVDL